MEIRTILVNLDVDLFSPPLVKYAADLAQRFNADLIGLAAAQPSSTLIGVEGGGAMATLYAEERKAIETRLRTLEDQFRALLPTGIKAEWRSFPDAPNRILNASARCADLILTGSRLATDHNYLRSVDVGELVLTAGRPVLVAGAGIAESKAEKIAVGWKDTREARRAVSDALPFLKAARDVVVVTISEGDPSAEEANLNDVVAWMKRHDVAARGDVYSAEGGLAVSLEEISKKLGTDLIVTGGYGHSRLREWLFGGMTRDLLAAPTMSRFMSN